MTHLTPDELVDAVEGSLAQDRRVHFDGCTRCQEQVRELTAVLQQASEVEVPEPSPLFWDHLSARVRQALDAEAAPAAGWTPAWLRWAVLGPVAALALIVFAIATAVPRPWELAALPSPSAQAPRADGINLDGEDASWALVTELAGTLNLDEAEEAGLLAGPGDAERAAMALDATEQAELLRLLRAELDRPKS